MRVLHVIPSVSAKAGGPSYAIFPMCRALQELGMEVILATTDHGIEPARNGSASVPFKGVPTHIFPSRLGESFKYSRRLARWMDHSVKDFDLVHIHAVFNHSSIAAARACARHKVPYIVRPLGSLDPWGMLQKPTRKKLFWKIVGASMCRRSAAIHYTTTKEKDASEAFLGLNHGAVIPLGIDEVSAELKNESHEALRLRKPYVLVLSRILPTKGLDILLSAFLSVVAQPSFSNWSLVIAGAGHDEYLLKLKALVQNNGCDKSVFFTGWLDEQNKYQALRNASLLALLSQHENFGLCVLEALSCGVPVLVSPHVGLAPEIISHDAGWVVPVTHDSIARVLNDVLGNHEALGNRGAAGKQLSRQFAWSVVGKQLEALYQSIVAAA